ncbi:MAG TPA: hypothetical protein VFI31_21350, partial [Pirellulales bacterium]|nr:hypothetical protein [Pirellulales bacterium]
LFAQAATNLKPFLLYDFRGKREEWQIINRDLNIENATIRFVNGAAQGLELSAEFDTAAMLAKELPDLRFERDFTVYVEMNLDPNTRQGNWTIIETVEGTPEKKREPGGFSLKLNVNPNQFQFTFHLDSNERDAVLVGDASGMRELTKVAVTRNAGQVSISAWNERNELAAERHEAAMSGVPKRNGTLRFGCFPGTLFAAGVWTISAEDIRDFPWDN